MGVGALPVDDNGKNVLGLWDDATGKPIPIHVGAKVTGSDGNSYALLDVNATVSPAANQRVNAHSGDFVAGSLADGAITTLGLEADANTVNTVMGRLTKIRDLLNATLTVGGTLTEANSAAILAKLVVSPALEGGNLASIKSDLDTLVVNTADLLADGDQLATIATNTTGIATQATLASMLTALNTLVTDNADLLADGDNLATIQTNTAAIPAKGTAVMTGSTPVTIATDDTQMTAIKNSVANLLAKGSATSANSSPVVIASDQGAVAVKLSPSNSTILASAARTTTQTSGDQINTVARGVRVVLDVTSAGTGSVTLAINGKDSVSGRYVAQLTGAAVTTNSTNVYVIYPGLTPSANSVVSDVIPVTWQVVVTANNGNSATYSVGVSYLL